MFQHLCVWAERRLFGGWSMCFGGRGDSALEAYNINLSIAPTPVDYTIAISESIINWPHFDVWEWIIFFDKKIFYKLNQTQQELDK